MKFPIIVTSTTTYGDTVAGRKLLLEIPAFLLWARPNEDIPRLIAGKFLPEVCHAPSRVRYEGAL